MLRTPPRPAPQREPLQWLEMVLPGLYFLDEFPGQFSSLCFAGLCLGPRMLVSPLRSGVCPLPEV